MARVEWTDFFRTAANAECEVGTVWTSNNAEDLNINLISFPEGRGVQEHQNDEVDVLVVGVSGVGMIIVNGCEYDLSPGTAILIPKAARRATLGTSANFSYLSVHRRRGPLQIGRQTGDEG